MSQAAVGTRERLAELLDQVTGERGRSADGDLLPKDRPDGELESVRCARDTHPGVRKHQ